MGRTLLDYCSSSPTLEGYAWNVVSGLKQFTADDLHVLEGEIEHMGYDKRVIGALLKSLESQGKIEKIGYVASARKKCHFRPIMRWRVVEKPEFKHVGVGLL